MNTTIDFLNQLKAKFSLSSNYALAKKLGQTDTAIARWAHGKNTFSDETAIKVAELLELDPAYVVACIHAERAKHEGEKRLWERIATMAMGVTAFLAVIMIAPLLFANPADIGVYAVGFIGNPSTLYIMSNWQWLIFLPLFALLLLAAPRHNSIKKAAPTGRKEDF
jgi:plasmid maintenance system antidote protein VapI